MKSLFTFCILLTLSINSLADEKLGNKEVLLNNSAVEVVRLTYPVGTESGVHTHTAPHRVVYFVKGGKLELIPEKKHQQSQVINVSEGQTLFLPSTTHNVRNIGSTEVVIVETELKVVNKQLK
jgi:oxalate decarboxylase/phosphoglucose isomerase-like protein (cupin superfamily)